MKLSFVSIFNLLLLIQISFSSSSDCESTTPSEPSDCTNIERDDKNYCCYVSYNSIKQCKNIKIEYSGEQVQSGIEEFKQSLTNPQNFEYVCETEVDKCQKVINPAEKLACTGRPIVKGYSCCFVEYKGDKTERSCYPFHDGKDTDAIDLLAEELKTKNNWTEEPSILCLSSYQSFSILSVLILIGMLI